MNAIYKQWYRKRQQHASALLASMEWKPPPDTELLAPAMNDSLIESDGNGGDATQVEIVTPAMPTVDVDVDVQQPLSEQLMASPVPGMLDAEVKLGLSDFQLDELFKCLYDFQQQGMPKAIDLACRRHRSFILIEKTGLGKSFFMRQFIEECRKLRPDLYPREKIWLWLTPGNVVAQTNGVVGMEGLKNVWVLGCEQLRSRLGQLFIEFRTVIVNGAAQLKPFWRHEMVEMLCAVIVDEVQKAKNEDSLYSQIIQQLSDFNAERMVLPVFMMSAGPYSRPCQTRAVAVNLKPVVTYGYDKNRILDNRIWPHWIREISAPHDVREWSKVAMKRIQAAFEPYTVRFGKAKFKHPAHFHQILINFRCAEHQRIYLEAFAKYQEERIKAEKDPLYGNIAMLVAKNKFIEVAELVRSEDFADAIAAAVKKGKNVVAGFRHLETLDTVRSFLLQKGYAEDDMVEISSRVSGKPRDKSRRLFQSEVAKICLMTITAGGVGLSLHQYKPKNVRPREVFCSAVWNDLDMLQFAGRAHRINSDSTTHTYILAYAGTEEVDQLSKLKYKLGALKEITQSQDGIEHTEKHAQAPERLMIEERSVGDEDAAEEIETCAEVIDTRDPLLECAEVIDV